MATQRAEQFKIKGNDSFKAQDYINAIKHYTDAMLLDPSNAIYATNRAMAYLKLGKFRDAERDCSTALTIQPTNVKALWRRGIARRELDNFNGAKMDLEKAASIEPSNISVKEELDKVLSGLKAMRLKKLPKGHELSSGKKDEGELIKAISSTRNTRKTQNQNLTELPNSLFSNQELITPITTTTSPTKSSTLKTKTFVHGTKKSDTNIFPISSTAAAKVVNDNKIIPTPVRTDPLFPESSDLIFSEPTVPTISEMAETPINTVYEGIKKNTSVIPATDKATVPDSVPPKTAALSTPIVPLVQENFIPIQTIQTAKILSPLTETISPLPVTSSKSTIVTPVPMNPTPMEMMNNKPISFGDVTPQKPKNSLAFESDWRSKESNMQFLVDFIRSIPPDYFPTMFKLNLQVEHLIWITRLVVDAKFSNIEAKSILRGLSKCERFDVVVLFLSDEEKHGLTSILADDQDLCKRYHV